MADKRSVPILGDQTQTTMLTAARAMNGKKRRTKKRRTKKKAAARRAPRKKTARKSRAKKPLKKGSAAAKRRMAQLRRMRRK